jgi:enoyl-CoA hydratase
LSDDDEVVLFDPGVKGVGLVTLNRPFARNAVNRALAERLSAVVVQTEADDNIRVVVLTGAGEQAFCAGADLKEVDAGGMDALFLSGGFAGFVDVQRKKPWIAAINGFALAGGFEIALACDLIVASEAARFGLPEVARGLIAAAGGAYRLGRRIPPNVATDLILTARMMDALEAERWGVVNRLTPPNGVISAAMDMASAIVRNAPLAISEGLKLARSSPDLSDQQLGAMSRAALMQLAMTDDFAEGPRAFVEKRAPVWKGR